jgi:poly(A)-specific ribonuclease
MANRLWLKQISTSQQEKQEAIGFRKVIDLMSSSGKTIVGHNVFLDLCHMVNQFIAPLPPNVADFKRMVHSRFPW